MPAGLAATLTGCATIVSGTSQVINVQAIDANTHEVIPSAKCTLTNSKGVVYPINSNPGSINVERVYGGLQTNCFARHYRQKAVAAGESFNAWTVMDILLTF